MQENAKRGVQESSTAWRRIAESIARELAQGAWASGEALPTAQDLARQYGVHRHTVRQAYKHLQDMGLVAIRQGLGTFVTSAPLPYRLGKRVSFRENLRAFDVEAESRVLSTKVVTASPDIARDLGCSAGAMLWRFELVNSAGGVPVSVSRHYLSRARFAHFPRMLAENSASFTAAFRGCGIERYERRSTRIAARLATPSEQEFLGLSGGAPVLATRSIDDASGEPLQLVEAAFSPDQIELVVENN